MSRSLCTLLFLTLLIGSSSARHFHKRDVAQRLCGKAFLERFEAVRDLILWDGLCNRSSRTKPEWYRQPHNTENELQTFCCKFDCSTSHFVEWHCSR